MATQGGPATRVSVQAGGQLQGGAALPVAVVTDGRAVEAGPAQPVYVVASGPIQGGPAVPVVLAVAGAFVESGAAIPVFVVSGSLGGATFRGAAGAGTSAAGTSLVIPVPTGVQNGDVMLAAIAVRGGSGVTNMAIAGWTNLFTTNQSTNVQLSVFFKVASSEPTSYTATWMGSFNAAGGIYAASGAQTGTPLSGNQANAASVNVIAPSISPSGPALLIFVGGMSAGATFTPPPTMLERLDVKSTAGAANAALEFADEILTTGGATGTRVAVADASGGNVGALIALLNA